MYFLNIALLLHPDKVMSPFTPGQPPSKSSCLILDPGKMKNGGTLFPKAFTHPITVTVCLDPDVMAGGLKVTP